MSNDQGEFDLDYMYYDIVGGFYFDKREIKFIKIAKKSREPLRFHMFLYSKIAPLDTTAPFGVIYRDEFTTYRSTIEFVRKNLLCREHPNIKVELDQLREENKSLREQMDILRTEMDGIRMAILYGPGGIGMRVAKEEWDEIKNKN